MSPHLPEVEKERDVEANFVGCDGPWGRVEEDEVEEGRDG